MSSATDARDLRREDRPPCLVQEVLKGDVVKPPSTLLGESQVDLGSGTVPVERYTSKRWADLELERLWPRVWQFACREEEIPTVGDYITYDLVDTSVVVVRTATGLRAYHNACLHRGTRLCDDAGRASVFRCPFHGFKWSIEGELVHVPDAWDFPDLRPEEWSLPEAHVDSWGGFVFVCLDARTPPLRSYLEILPEHLAPFRLEERFKAVHVSQVVPCNWKVALEAFFEGFHVATTHPQSLRTYDSAVQYDVWPHVEHTSRLVLLGAMPSPNFRGRVSEDEVLGLMQKPLAPDEREQLAHHGSARAASAVAYRKDMSRRFRADLSETSDTEVLDQIQYFMFPNVIPWPGVGAPLVYRLRPISRDPNESLMEVMYLHPRPEDGSEPEVAEEIRLEPGQAWSSEPSLGGYGPVFDQDMPNLARLQRGLRSTRKDGVTFASYQESRLRHFHHVLGNYVEEKGAR